MTMGEFRKRTSYVPDNWPLRIADDQQRLFDIHKYIIATPELGNQVVLILEEEPCPK